MARIPKLFQPVSFRSVEARNRIVVSPMCQYSAIDGLGQDWHIQNLGAKAMGGAGIVFTEATHVSPAARITAHCLGLWNDGHEAFMKRLVALIEYGGAVPAIQIAHAGRKASQTQPWKGDGFVAPDAADGWLPVAPSPLPFAPDRPAPHELTAGEIAAIVGDFAATTARARRAGFRIVELHAAHGYLLHQFLSPVSNHRTDAYGGDLANRARIVMEAIDAMRAEWPDDLPFFVRLSCTDWIEGGFDADQAVTLCRWLAARGDVDLIDSSTGGISPQQRIPSIHPGYQVPFAERIRREAGIATGAVGMIREPELAAEIVANERADLVFLARALLADPAWPIRAAQHFGLPVDLVPQYQRALV
ncbi:MULTISPECIES: NADH:flavin oxidoreductase/NADH oxidase [Acidiphilium]|uniref:NADH:flavin oxidoreductase/NADH oxidase n=2 Tax=Acidiphilium TaxID=522 RepID=A5G2J0_ACICJ|nr:MULTISPECIES: NADH:flavin oxidoreductase/NADH oxidase [Acidiphilium]MBU6356779.1 NADH:flavin oxidoreductase/NADH oxidase [Rhodospirillales bacterium]ABQ32072.1 NADH:flavin oxidoreductase/NADH oxidase [Acidiphilium cryptum JF-5]MBS3022753.1 NADH:flavin oxidoreductase/NADH oxidase [Acidiphilium multivorum]MDE2327285.1 NADH:flavin oxidoreductase/NADH oxidase [Rhodospirillales bacterium]UNC14495.1 NADH:flavin oxidoreductase/NADH oxidase [Acidiphilium multivorum]